MIEVKRTDRPERIVRYRNGTTKTIPARYECVYYFDGKDIAFYDSQDDVLYLKTSLIENARNKKDYQRALDGKYSEVYNELFHMLGADETSHMSEYMNL